ncbi:Cyclase/dehydrase [Penicillium concentricum]|uniref:Cyclase/dehydrase n=1 Tax=Penicillium concentricum TaxID=293559 RepID=A0A9W9S641_9EURO|nr:Cyclase/dehydrase [Penicillium concentricum]KAJ5372545.1 Cyclase/dehydrase [Penicillium concentricum]
MTTLTDPTNATRATPNIPVEKATLHIGSSTFIRAPSQEVWAALTNTSTWPSWNTFVPRVTIRSQPTPDPSPSTSAPDPTPASTSTSTTTPQSTDTTLSPILQKGTKFTLHVRMDSASTKPQPSTDVHALISEYSAPDADGQGGRIVWISDAEAPGAFSPSLLQAERVHEFTAVEGGTVVRNWEAQNGWLAYVVRWMYQVKLQGCFEMWLADLKKFVEGSNAAS